MENKLREKLNTLKTYIIDIRDNRFDDKSLDYMEQQLEELETLINKHYVSIRDFDGAKKTLTEQIIEMTKYEYYCPHCKNEVKINPYLGEDNSNALIKKSYLKTNTDKEVG